MDWTTLKGFRDPERARAVVRGVRQELERVDRRLGRKLRLMEVCGTHTVSFSRSGVRSLLGDLVELVSGPGCPVCVTDQADIDAMIETARLPGVIVTTFGDMMRVPGSRTTLQQERTRGADVRVVYSPLDALKVAEERPEATVVFLGVGFETTAPAVAHALLEAEARRLRNFAVLSAHKYTPPAVRALLAAGGAQLDGFVLPGHVSVVTGTDGWRFLAREFGLPGVVTGFEPLDLLAGVGELASLVAEGRAEVRNAYPRTVQEHGNPHAQELIRRVFRPAEAVWRGLGPIPESGMAIAGAFAAYDARKRLELELPPSRVPPGCRCGDVLQGKILPTGCRLFAVACRPERPIGPCMVSSEGACAAYYQYEPEAVEAALAAVRRGPGGAGTRPTGARAAAPVGGSGEGA
ncbi:MAG: hydrogenase formation protein HypD [Firmicutes bacterium]|nr:hydrogenase formation protein HypD [Bacillota bacterium]